MKRFVALIAVCVACLSAASQAPAAPAPYTDAEKTIEAANCEEFSITLESNKTTGFGWDIAAPLNENVVKFVSCEYLPADTGLVGSGGKEIWTFRAMCPGKASIPFKYVRPWEKDVPPAKNMTFTVLVKEPPKDRNTQEAPCSGQR